MTFDNLLQMPYENGRWEQLRSSLMLASLNFFLLVLGNQCLRAREFLASCSYTINSLFILSPVLVPTWAYLSRLWALFLNKHKLLQKNNEKNKKWTRITMWKFLHTFALYFSSWVTTVKSSSLPGLVTTYITTWNNNRLYRDMSLCSKLSTW